LNFAEDLPYFLFLLLDPTLPLEALAWQSKLSIRQVAVHAMLCTAKPALRII